jgi:malonate-semialdehyde dehydrogenase (acetylating) / methylmalonate-semialdehyde dehydrogenase
MDILDHWVSGASFAGVSTRTSPVYNPAEGIVSREVRLATVGDVDTAVQSAKAASPAWAETSLAKRQSIMFTFRELLNARKEEVAAILTNEHGKVTSDALGEVARGLEVVEWATSIPHLMKGEHSENVSTGVDVYSVRQPLGVVGIISPFNFPAMVPLWFFPVAIAAGNTVILKPSEKDPSAAIWMAKLLKEAGLPDGVLNVVHGDKESVDALLEHPDISAISFVGSTPIAKYIYETAAKNGKRVQALGGAKNHMLVLPDADLDLVADSAVNAGFGSAGERCMAISVVVAVEPVADELIEKITSRLAGLTVGDGTRGCDMGPLITKEHRDKVASYIDIATADGATVVVDGRGVTVDGGADGFWLGPTLIDGVSTDSDVYKHEIFGPVLSIVRVASYDEGVGMVGINVPIPVPVGYYSFGGWKDSLFGDTKAYGSQAVHFYTREKAITSRWLDPSHGGINLGFPQN